MPEIVTIAYNTKECLRSVIWKSAIFAIWKRVQDGEPTNLYPYYDGDARQANVTRWWSANSMWMAMEGRPRYASKSRGMYWCVWANSWILAWMITRESTFSQPIIKPSFFFSDFEWVFDGLIFNENFQPKVENWATPSMDLLKTDGTKYTNDL